MRDRKEVDLDGRKRRKELGGVTMEETVILLSCVCVCVCVHVQWSEKNLTGITTT